MEGSPSVALLCHRHGDRRPPTRWRPQSHSNCREDFSHNGDCGRSECRTSRCVHAERPRSICKRRTDQGAAKAAQARPKEWQRREISFAKPPNAPLGVGLLQDSSGTYVTYVNHGSPAWRVGLEVGDRLERVGEVDLYSAGGARLDVTSLLRQSALLELRVCEKAVFHTVRVVLDGPCQELGVELDPVSGCWMSVPGKPLHTALCAAGLRVDECAVAQVGGEEVMGMTESKLAVAVCAAMHDCGCVDITVAPRRFVVEAQARAYQKAPRKRRGQ